MLLQQQPAGGPELFANQFIRLGAAGWNFGKGGVEDTKLSTNKQHTLSLLWYFYFLVTWASARLRDAYMEVQLRLSLIATRDRLSERERHQSDRE